MVELRKVIVFIFVLFFFVYMIWINFSVLNKFGYKKLLFVLMISGLGLILIGIFFDMILSLLGMKFRNLI